MRVCAGLLAAVVWLAVPTIVQAETLVGRCVSVHDGDTITVLAAGKKEKIRLLGIDSPELKQAPWGARARDYAAGLALNQEVRVETDVQPRDRYGRLLGYVYVGKTFLNLAVIEAGHAMLLTYPPNVAHVSEFTAAQTAARTGGRGVWDTQSPLTQTPYQFRHPGASAKPDVPVKVAPALARPTDAVRYNLRSKKIHTAGCGHACDSCKPMTLAEAQELGGTLCKRR